MFLFRVAENVFRGHENAQVIKKQVRPATKVVHREHSSCSEVGSSQ